MSNWRVRTKLVVVMTPLALAVLGLAGIRVVAQENAYGELVSAQHALEVCARGWEVTDALQSERSAVVSFIHGGRRDTASLIEAAHRVDTAREHLRAAVRKPEHLNAALAVSADKVLTELEGLDALRLTVQQTRYPGVSALARYGQILDGLVRMGSSAANSVSTLPVGSEIATLQSLGAAQEHLATQNAILLTAAHTRDLPPQQATLLRATQARFDAALGEFNAAAGPQLRQHYQDTVSGAEVDERSRLVQLALVQSGANRPIVVDASAAVRTGQATADRITAVRNEVTANAATATDALATGARLTTVAVSGGIVAVLLIAFAVVVLVARTILRPLRVLRRTALRVAEHDLPDAIDRILAHSDPLTVAGAAVQSVPIHSQEEMGQLARAFDTVHAAAVHLAAQHAILRDGVNAGLVNLARRSQTLIEQLIKVIDALELDEQDPDRLARLFELDHLATRMRRNSENLLVLSGAERGVRLLASPVAVHEVLGAAISEVEQFTRVDIEVKADVKVLGHVVKDLVHLVAELLDNATVVSPPTTKVRLRAALDRARNLVIEVSDAGLGMPEDQIEHYNQQLATPPDLDVRAAKRMGLHVVGRLAQRHNITARLLTNNLDDGITATVKVPSTLLVAPQPPALPAMTVTAAMPAGQGSGEPRPELDTVAHGADLLQPRERCDTDEAAASTGLAQDPAPRWTEPPARRAVARHAVDVAVAHTDDRAADDEPVTERLEPIQELSAWFLSTQDNTVTPSAGEGAMRQLATGTAVATPTQATSALAELAASRKRLRAATAVTWDSPGDPGWQAANAILAAAQPELRSPDELPKRTRGACLVPGSPLAPSTATIPQPSPVPTPAVDPMHTRERLARFQKGVQRGREETTAPTTDPATTEVTDQ